MPHCLKDYKIETFEMDIILSMTLGLNYESAV